MALTKEELHDINDRVSTKGDLNEALSDHEDDHPGLEKVDPDDQTRSEMIETAEQAIEEGLSAEGKRRALKQLLDGQPSTVLHLARQAFLRLEHPREEDRTFVMNVFTDMGWAETTPNADPESEDEDPAEKPTVDQVEVALTPLSEVPEWALPQVYDLIMRGDIEVFETPREAQNSASGQVKGNEQPILDEPSRPVRMERTRDEDSAGVGQTAPVVTEPNADFDRPEQVCAWRVLAKTVDGEDPLPSNPDEISADHNDLTVAEKQLVEHRIRQCLEAPQRYNEEAVASTFDKRVFFDQLLQLEMDGATAPRNREQKISGVTRPEIIRLIRKIADEHGFEAVGTYVQEKPDTGLDDQLPETVPMTPESDRKHDPNARPDPTRDY